LRSLVSKTLLASTSKVYSVSQFGISTNYKVTSYLHSNLNLPTQRKIVFIKDSKKESFQKKLRLKRKTQFNSQDEHDKKTISKIKGLPEEQKGLINFLYESGFDTFATLTTCKPMGITSARRHAETFGKFISAGIDTNLFWCAEPFDIRVGYHLHALIGNKDRNEFQRKAVNQMYSEYWGNRYGEIRTIKGKKKFLPARCNFLPIRGKFNAEYYVTKYITKKLADYDFYLIGMNSIKFKPETIKPYPECVKL